MTEIYPVMHKCRYFDGIPEEKYPNVLHCLRACRKSYQKDETVLGIGAQTQQAGVVLSGTLELVFYDENGNQINVNHISSGEVFGAELACSNRTKSPVHLRTVTGCEILFLDFNALLNPDAPPCPFRMRVAVNLLRDFAQQSLFLNQRLRIIGQKRLRDKIKVYLQTLELDENSCVELPFSRNEMADFLYADRSALSRELSRMQKEGILSFHGQHFCILRPEFLQ